MNIKFGLLSIVLLLGISTLFGQEVSLSKTKVTKKISMMLPDDFVPMTVQQQRQKYVTDKEPIAMYTTADGLVDLGINLNKIRWATGDLDIVRGFYKAGILNLYDTVTFIKDEVVIIDDREFIVYEFIGTLFGNEDSFRGKSALSKYIYIQYTMKEEGILLFNFSAPYQLKSRWEVSVPLFMNSIDLK
ncbi:MAG: hypothetical protein ACI8QD_000280 [Cyclobacteriaceae bacterium]|jgi:hypothetical protein